MIKLFSTETKEFKTNGDIVLQPFRCIITNKDNGDFIMEMEAPVTYADDIEGGKIIVAPTPGGEQPFRIWNVEKTGKKINIKAKHIYYDSANYLIRSAAVENRGCWYTMAQMNTHTDTESPFSVYSDIKRYNSYDAQLKTLNEALNDILGIWGGHLRRDGWNISIYDSLENDNGIVIRYGKNLQEITATYDWSNVCTKLLPTGKNGITLRRIYLYSDRTYPIPYTKTVSFNQEHIKEEDYKDAEGNTKTAEYEEALRADLVKQGEQYLRDNSLPSVNYTLKGRPEKISDIGDVIEVIDERIGVRITTQVISYQYDAIAERYKEMEFGNFKKDLRELIKDIR